VSHDVDVRVIATTVHGRYLVRPARNGRTTGALIGFHGYGQNAGDMLAELEQVPGADEWLLVSIQGLHRFYTRGHKRVIASWMTREDRELAIASNVQYVDAVVSALKAAHDIRSIVYLGFSQGVAMAFRAAALGTHPSHAILALAGDVPPDVREVAGGKLPPVVIARGTADDWYVAERFASDVEWLSERAALRASVEFEGGHEFGPTFRLAAGAVLASLR
jgi:predicted esterase